MNKSYLAPYNNMGQKYLNVKWSLTNFPRNYESRWTAAADVLFQLAIWRRTYNNNNNNNKKLCGRPPQYALSSAASGDLKSDQDHLSLTFWPWNWCAVSRGPRHGQPSAQFWCFCDLSSYGQTRIKLTRWRDNLDFWPLTSRTAHASYAVRRTPSPNLKLAGLLIPKLWPIFDHGIKRPGDLDLWPFDLQAGVQYHPLRPFARACEVTCHNRTR